MPTSHFDRFALPPARTFYQQQFGSALGRERRGWAQTKCCFHDGKSKTSLSLNLIDGHFCCFKCGVKGSDIVKFVMLLYKLDFRRAAQFLGAWRDGMTPEESQAIRGRQQERERQQANEIEQNEAARLERIAAREHLHAVATSYREACTEHDWQLMAELLPRVRQLEERYARLAGLDLPYEY